MTGDRSSWEGKDRRSWDLFPLPWESGICHHVTGIAFVDSAFLICRGQVTQHCLALQQYRSSSHTGHYLIDLNYVLRSTAYGMPLHRLSICTAYNFLTHPSYVHATANLGGSDLISKLPCTSSCSLSFSLCRSALLLRRSSDSRIKPKLRCVSDGFELERDVIILRSPRSKFLNCYLWHGRRNA
ncbi:hypothetical protein M405DRAFT_229489 [Rhizopogon salebrosus TDB-379]|nr:hypothetical protein M405DRAFT_229489 [Rhizopogon salebrosus TDB-379]